MSEFFSNSDLLNMMPTAKLGECMVPPAGVGECMVLQQG